MRLSHLLNPLQWNFGPRTFATLLTWAFLPVGLVTYVALERLRSTAETAGLRADQRACCNPSCSPQCCGS